MEQGDPLPSDQAPEDPKSTQQDQGGQVFPDEDQSHQDLHQDLQDLQFQSAVHHQQELFQFEAEDSNSKAPFPDITPKSASESHFPWDADELEAPAVDTAVLADNDVTVDPPAAKRRKGPKRHDEAWDPAEDSSGEEQPEVGGWWVSWWMAGGGCHGVFFWLVLRWMFLFGWVGKNGLKRPDCLG